MVVFQVVLTIKLEYVETFTQMIVANATQTTATEAGNFRFEVFTSKDEPNKFVLFEIYASVEAQQAHRETAHYKTWKEGTAHMIADRVAIAYNPVFPATFQK